MKCINYIFSSLQPPIVNNLPRTITIKEGVARGSPVYRLNVTDGGNDPICCSIYDTSPLTTNFQLKQDDNGKSFI